MGRGLRREGFEVVTAVSGEDALRIVQELRRAVDVAVVDIFLPDSWGSSLAFTLKQSYPAVVLIYMSGYAETDPILRDFEDPDVVLLSKPFELEELTKAIRQRISDG